MLVMMNEDGVFEEYDDKFDVVIHCTSKEERDEVVFKLQKILNEAAGISALLNELKRHREAWGKAKRTVKAYLILEKFGSEYQEDIEKLIDECIPKDGDAE